MADINVVNTKIVDFNEPVTKVINTATEEVADTSQIFNVDVNPDWKASIEINPGTGGNLTVDIPAGVLWNGLGAKQFVVESGTIEVIELEKGRFAGTGGVIPIELTPASDEALATVGASISVIETK